MPTPTSYHTAARCRALIHHASWWLLSLLLLNALIACARPSTQDVVTTPDQKQHPWQPRFEGIHLAQIVVTEPRPLRVYAVRIDLHAAGIGFFVSPAQDATKGIMRSMHTSTFLEKYGCQIAVNGSPFGPVVKEENQPQQVMGLNLSQGIVSSQPNTQYGLLLFTADNRVSITRPPVNLSNYHNGLGGFHLLLDDGKPVPQKNNDIHPRTAAGLSRDQRHFYLLVIDGRQPNYSEGVTLAETAQWLQLLGCWWAINLDGGGSTTLALADETGKAQVINVPIDRGLPGTQRPNANHLGIFARPLQ